MADTVDYGYYAMAALTVALIVYIWRLRMRNIANSQDKIPIAGEDTLEGAAKNPEQFANPDDDALDEMQDLLEKAAESQGLTYDE